MFLLRLIKYIFCLICGSKNSLILNLTNTGDSTVSNCSIWYVPWEMQVCLYVIKKILAIGLRNIILSTKSLFSSYLLQL